MKKGLLNHSQIFCIQEFIYHFLWAFDGSQLLEGNLGKTMIPLCANEANRETHYDKRQGNRTTKASKATFSNRPKL